MKEGTEEEGAIFSSVELIKIMDTAEPTTVHYRFITVYKTYYFRFIT